MDPDLYDDKPWYSWATDSLGNVVGDTINFSDDSSDFFYTSAFFIHYEYDVVTDQEGGIHFVAYAYPYLCKDLDGGCDDSDGDGVADSIFADNRFAGAGMYHYYNPNPVEQPDDWTATFI